MKTNKPTVWRSLLALVILLMSMFSTSAVTVKVWPSFGPPKNAASFAGYSANAVSQIKAGNLPAGTRTSPTDATLLVGKMVGEDFMTTTSTPFYRGSFSPTAPFENERGGTVWYWLDVVAGEEMISLADITLTIKSSDTGNILGKTASLAGTLYSPTSIGIRADGTVLDSGPATQEVKRVIVAIGSKSFTVNSAVQVTEVRDYIASFPNWNVQVEASIKGNQTPIQIGTPGRPRLTGSIESGKFFVVAENNGDTTDYAIELTDMLEDSSTYWVPQETIRAGQKKEIQTIGNRGGEARFVRYKPSP